MNRTVRFGIIGTGGIAVTHAEALKRSRKAELSMVYDRDPKRAEDFSNRFGCRIASSLETLLDSDVEAVTIATPSGTHADVAVPAAEAGKHIFCEKPLDVSAERAEKIIQACKAGNVILTAVMPLRFCDSTQWLQKAITGGYFGNPVLSSASMRWYRTPEYYSSVRWRGTRAIDGSILMNQGIHLIDLLLYLNGDVETVSAFATKRMHDIEVEDTVVASIRFVNGSMGTFEASTACAPGNPKRFEFSGTHGSVLLEDDQIIRSKFEAETKPPWPEPANNQSVQDAGTPVLNDCELHYRQLEDMVSAILTGSALKVSGEEGLRTITLIEAIMKSAEKGESIKIG
ncbi:MAG: Gfo/Idh/MocA family oxidoreductase [Victivallaceae bacterium]|mgnify:FL=1|nr:Gfo/Idh/MocA family oxidoreductase [Victivallaceae bacterium]